MPDKKLIKKAGKILFLLVCLFLCTACGGSKTVFMAGDPLEIPQNEEKMMMEQEGSLEEQSAEKAPETEESRSASGTSLVNINTADAAELMTLPGIGETRAAAIIEYRTNVGKFEKNEDLMNVKGIKNGVFSKIGSLICVK